MNFCGIHFHAGTPVSSGFFAGARAARDAEKSVPAAGDARILLFDGETPPTTDVLLLLSRQCNYAKCPNVCVEDEEYFYAWRERRFSPRHPCGQKKSLSSDLEFQGRNVRPLLVKKTAHREIFLSVRVSAAGTRFCVGNCAPSGRVGLFFEFVGLHSRHSLALR